MKLALIAVGQAGGKVADRFVEYDAKTDGTFLTSVTAINTAKTDLDGLELVPRDRRILVGETQVGGHGVGADNELGAEIAAEDRAEILRAMDDVPVGRTDGFLVVGALGGGTGSGAGPVVARHLSEVFSEPVYGLGILPATDEGGIYTLNAARSFRTFAREVDNLLLFDNDAWRKPAETLADSYDTINREIARRFGVLFSAGEVDATDDVAESVVDASEIVNTLSEGGVSTVGYAAGRIAQEAESKGRFGFLRNGTRETDGAEATNRIQSSIRQATRGRLTLPCEVSSAERALVVVSGPPDVLNRRGVERGRKWLETETGTMEIRGGDYPVRDSDHVSAAVLLSGVTGVPRLTELQNVAVDAKETIAEREAAHERDMDEMLAEFDEELDPLF